MATGLTEPHFIATHETSHEHSSGISWSAVIGGAFVAASISLIMLALGAGFGLSEVSPWSNIGASALGTAAIVWLIVNEAISCALGGYLAGRLRTKWVAVHTDEVYFRDTANGFLVWAVAVVMTVTFMVSSASSMVGRSTPREASSDRPADPHAYFVNRLFRSETPTPIDASLNTEAGLILANTLRQSDASGADQAYLAKLVATKTGLSHADAEKRVAEVTSEVRQAEDAARKTAARFLLWTFLALLIGAFTASYGATIGGRQRDHVKVI
jgi:hypothetical protein